MAYRDVFPVHRIAQRGIAFLGPQVRDMAAWGLLFALLAFWPGGLMGTKALDRTMAVGRRV